MIAIIPLHTNTVALARETDIDYVMTRGILMLQ